MVDRAVDPVAVDPAPALAPEEFDRHRALALDPATPPAALRLTARALAEHAAAGERVIQEAERRLAALAAVFRSRHQWTAFRQHRVTKELAKPLR